VITAERLPDEVLANFREGYFEAGDDVFYFEPCRFCEFFREECPRRALFLLRGVGYDRVNGARIIRCLGRYWKHRKVRAYCLLEECNREAPDCLHCPFSFWKFGAREIWLEWTTSDEEVALMAYVLGLVDRRPEILLEHWGYVLTPSRRILRNGVEQGCVSSILFPWAVKALLVEPQEPLIYLTRTAVVVLSLEDVKWANKHSDRVYIAPRYRFLRNVGKGRVRGLLIDLTGKRFQRATMLSPS